MSYRLFAALLCLCTGLSSLSAQQVAIRGTVLDSTSLPLPGASIMLVTDPDEALEAFGITNAEGQFELYTGASGDFLVKITFVGYGTFARKVVLADQDVNLGDIVLEMRSYALDGVTIEDSFIPIVITEDTITYAADAFRTEEDATVEDLLKKLPGVEVDADGTITAQGEEVEKILVDGKEFFEDDPKVASQNIPADVVDKVQVFDKQSEFTEFTGIEDGQEVKAINLQIKEGKNKGWFGNVEGEYGLDNRYNAGGNINRFNERMQLSLIGNSNNINEMPFTIMDYLRFTDGFADVMNGGFDRSQLPTNILNRNGVNQTHSAGLNFNFDFSPNTTWRSNYFYNQSDNNTLQTLTADNVLDGRSFGNTSTSDDASTLGSHRFTGKLKHSIDSTQDISIAVQANLTQTTGNVFTEAASFIEDSLLNQSTTSDIDESAQNGWEVEAAYRKRLRKTGRFLTLEASFNQGMTDIDALFDNRIYFGQPISDSSITDQQRITRSDELGYTVSLDYVEPIGTGQYLNFGLERGNSSQDRLLLYQDAIAENSYQINYDLSSDYTRLLDRSTAGMTYKLIKPRYNLSLGADLQLLELDNEEFIANAVLDENYWNVLPNGRFRYTIGSGKSLDATYRTSVTIPSIEQLQPGVDNSDPLNLYQGNPELDPEFNQNLNIRFRSFNQFYLRAFFAGVRVRYTSNRITESEFINSEFISVRTPVNSQAEWSTTAYYNYSSPFKRANLQYRIDGNINLTRSNVLVNALEDRALFATVSQTVMLENKKKKAMNLAGGFRIADTYTAYKVNGAQDQNFFNYALLGEWAITFGENWNLQIDAEYQDYLDSDFAEGDKFMFLNAQFSRYLMDKQLILHIRGNNLFDEEAGFQQTSAGNQNAQVSTNRIGRLLMLGASYKIRAFGK